MAFSAFINLPPINTFRVFFIQWFYGFYVIFSLTIFSERHHWRRVSREAANDCGRAECCGEHSVYADWSRHNSGWSLHVPDVSTQGSWGECPKWTLMSLWRDQNINQHLESDFWVSTGREIEQETKSKKRKLWNNTSRLQEHSRVH